MKKYTYIVPLLLLGVFASGVMVYAAQPNAGNASVYNPGYMFHGDTQKTSMRNQRIPLRTALENNDYNSFVEMMQQRPNAPSVTEEQFNTMQKAHQLCANGEFQEAQNLLNEAGIQRPQRMGR